MLEHTLHELEDGEALPPVVNWFQSLRQINYSVLASTLECIHLGQNFMKKKGISKIPFFFFFFINKIDQHLAFLPSTHNQHKWHIQTYQED